MTFITTPLVRSFVGFDNLFDELEKVSNFKEDSYPAYNIEKTDDTSYEISIALAGFQEKHLNIEVKQNMLTVSAVNEKISSERNFLHKGIATRAFTKQFRLAENVEVVSAAFENGLLSITLNRVINEKDLPRNIPINSKVKKISPRVA